MITIYKIENTDKRKTSEGTETLLQVELRGLSTDQKPTEINEKGVQNGSTFIEIDTGKVYLFDEENNQWKEV